MSFQICVLVSNTDIFFSLLLVEMLDKHLKVLSLVVLNGVVKSGWVAFNCRDLSLWVK
jgi:hypothetical protein